MRLKLQHVLPIVGIALSVNTYAQVNKGKPGRLPVVPEHRTCGTMDHHEFLKQTRQGYDKDFASYNKMLDAYLKENPSGLNKTANPSAQTIITIPVVIHVVWK